MKTLTIFLIFVSVIGFFVSMFLQQKELTAAFMFAMPLAFASYGSYKEEKVNESH